MSNLIPEILIGFRVYEGGNHYVGVADVELPKLETMTETIKGAGIAGEVEVAVLGQLSAMNAKLNWRITTKDTLRLAAPKVHELVLRGSAQYHDSGTGELETSALRIALRGRSKSVDPGKFDAAATMDASTEFSLTYLKIDYDGQTMIEYDPLAYKYVVDGVDYLAGVRKDLGV